MIIIIIEIVKMLANKEAQNSSVAVDNEVYSYLFCCLVLLYPAPNRRGH